MLKIMNIPSDLVILETIYEKYYDDYVSYQRGDETRSSKIYVPIVCGDIASQLKVDNDIIFGRLYYHLENKYGYRRDDESKVHFFALRFSDKEIHCINFPLMASVLASMQEEHAKFSIATTVSIVALAVSIISVSISIWLK